MKISVSYDLKNQFKTFSINLNAQYVYGMTHFDLTAYARLLGTVIAIAAIKLVQYLQTFIVLSAHMVCGQTSKYITIPGFKNQYFQER